MENILENTGYSYSGIADVIHNESKVMAKQLILEIQNKYQESLKKQEELEKELARTKHTRGLCVSSFVYVHKALDLGEKPLTFEIDTETGKELVVIDILSSRDEKINYNTIPLTHF